jgi:hypothetical protein
MDYIEHRSREHEALLSAMKTAQEDTQALLALALLGEKETSQLMRLTWMRVAESIAALSTVVRENTGERLKEKDFKSDG